MEKQQLPQSADIIDLGIASQETKGPGGPSQDTLNGLSVGIDNE